MEGTAIWTRSDGRFKRLIRFKVVVVSPFGHAFGVRVHRVLRVLRFDSGLWPLRVVVAAVAAVYSPLP